MSEINSATLLAQNILRVGCNFDTIYYSVLFLYFNLRTYVEFKQNLLCIIRIESISCIHINKFLFLTTSIYLSNVTTHIKLKKTKKKKALMDAAEKSVRRASNNGKMHENHQKLSATLMQPLRSTHKLYKYLNITILY